MARDLEIRHCRALVALHDGGGVGAAARALGVAQSTLSETLLSLERVMGVPVTVRRIGREATLTPAAEALLPYARSLIATAEAALAATAPQPGATIRIGTVESISSFLLPAPLRDFRSRWPNVEVRISTGLCEDLRRRVERAELDVALTIEGVGEGGGAGLWPARLCLVTAPGHPFAGRAAFRTDLIGQTFLLADPEGAFNGLMRTWLGRSGASPRLESAGSVEGVKRGLATSNAIGVLPDYTVTDEIRTGSLVALDSGDPLPPIALRLTMQELRPPDAPLESLLTILADALSDPEGTSRG